MPRSEHLLGTLFAAALVVSSGCSTQSGTARGSSGGVPAGTVRLHLLRGEEALQAGRPAAARAAAQRALRLDDRSGLAHTLMALSLERLGSTDEAGGHYARATELEPGSGSAANNYGAWLCLNGRAAESLAWFDRALADRGYATPELALANAGACAAEGGQPQRAERDLRNALALDPLNTVALEALARHLQAQGEYFEARAFSQRRLDAAPATPVALLLASQIEDKLGDKAAAARYVQRLRTEFPHAQTALPGDSSSR